MQHGYGHDSMDMDMAAWSWTWTCNIEMNKDMQHVIVHAAKAWTRLGQRLLYLRKFAKLSSRTFKCTIVRHKCFATSISLTKKIFKTPIKPKKNKNPNNLLCCKKNYQPHNKDARALPHLSLLLVRYRTFWHVWSMGPGPCRHRWASLLKK